MNKKTKTDSTCQKDIEVPLFSQPANDCKH